MKHLLLALVVVGCGVAGCASEDPTQTPALGGEGEGEGEGEGACATQAPATPARPAQDACPALPDDYPGDGWDACGAWVLAGDEAPSSAARVAAYEAIADLLWANPCVPTGDDFIAAQGIYGEDGGVGSRISKRYDARVPPPEGADCKAEDAGQRWPEYCVGPARIEPLILGAFQAGIAGEDRAANAAKIRSGLLWFYFVSAYKEAFTCADTKKDCDSSWAYYTGAKQLGDTQLGLAGEVVAAGHAAIHEAVFNALLGLRCWRELDPEPVATDDALRQRALAQLARALDRAWEVLAVPDPVPQTTGACD